MVLRGLVLADSVVGARRNVDGSTEVQRILQRNVHRGNPPRQAGSGISPNLSSALYIKRDTHTQ